MKISPCAFHAIQAMLLALLLLGIIFALNHPVETYAISFLMMGLGAILMFWGRLPLYRKKIFFSFGSKDLDMLHKILYYYSYIFLLPAFFLCIIRLIIDYSKQ